MKAGAEGPTLDEARRRAARRWPWRLALCGVSGAVGAEVFDQFLDGHRRANHHDHDWPAALITLAVILVLVGLVVMLVRRRSWFARYFAPPVTVGLARRDRRTVMRAIRRNEPSVDPNRREIETETARRQAMQLRRSVWIFPIIGLFELTEAISASTIGARTFFYLAVALFAVMFGMACLYLRSARRYLASVG